MVKTDGTKEWADTTENFFFGCSHECEYCYAKNIHNRFINDRITKLREADKIVNICKEWDNMILNVKNIAAGYSKRDGRIITPSSHDITCDLIDLKKYRTKLEELIKDKKISKKGYEKVNNLINRKIEINGGFMYVYELCAWKFEEMLKAGNELLITTKAKLDITEYLCDYLEEYKDRIQFRFTITSMNDSAMKFWEKGAPRFGDRLASLVVAHKKGFKTSVSIEPFLDKNPIHLITAVAPYCTETIWLGIMSGKTYTFHSKKNIAKIIDGFKDLDEEYQEKLRLKDSIRNLGFKYNFHLIAHKKNVQRADVIDIIEEYE